MTMKSIEIWWVKRKDYFVITAESIRKALDLISTEEFVNETPDIILTDIKMLHEDGLLLLKQIRKEYPDIFMILVTGYGEKKIVIEAVKGGAFAFLEKPFDDEKLKAAVNCATREMEIRIQLKKVKPEKIYSVKLASIAKELQNANRELVTQKKLLETTSKLVLWERYLEV